MAPGMDISPTKWVWNKDYVYFAVNFREVSSFQFQELSTINFQRSIEANASAFWNAGYTHGSPGQTSRDK
jgi:hypothetical protein